MDSRPHYNEVEEGNLCRVSDTIIVFGVGLQLPLPDTITRRVYHSLSAIQLSPHNVLLVAFGGWRSLGSAKLSDTILIELSEYVLQYSSYSVTHCTCSGHCYSCMLTCTLSMHAVQGEDDQ